jgi:3D (Asp-Asp-Asp) domain-containing protein
VRIKAESVALAAVSLLSLVIMAAGEYIHSKDVAALKAERLARRNQAQMAEKQLNQDKQTINRLNSQIQTMKAQIAKLKAAAKAQAAKVAAQQQHAIKQATPVWRTFWATWYAGSGGSDGYRITATGTYVQAGKTIAVDPRVIPLGKQVQIKFADGTIHTYTAQDTGGAIKGNRIDIYTPSLQAALANGVQAVKVRVLN